MTIPIAPVLVAGAPMTQPRDGNRGLLLRPDQHRLLRLLPSAKRYFVIPFVESSPIDLTTCFVLRLPFKHCWELSSRSPTLSSLGPRGFIPPLLRSSHFTHPSSPSPKRNAIFPNSDHSHSFCSLKSAPRDISPSILHALRVCALSFCPPKRTCFSVVPVKQTPPFPLLHQL